AGVVERLVGKAAGHGPISNHGDDLELLALQVSGGRHTVGGRERRTGMACPELVVLALIAPQKAGQAALLPQRVQPVVAAGEDLPRVALVADIPDDLV